MDQKLNQVENHTKGADVVHKSISISYRLSQIENLTKKNG